MQGEGFLPWIGERFAQQPQRLLLLGESHYVGERTGPNLTRELTREYRDGVWRHRYWTGLMQVVEGQPASEIDRVAFWNRVAFYNYVQTALDDSGIAPTRQAFQASDDAFFRVLDELRPHAMLVVSKRLWFNLPDEHGCHPAATLPGIRQPDTWVYRPPTLDGWPGVVCTWVPHASRFHWRDWASRVACLRELAVQHALGEGSVAHVPARTES